MIPPDRNADCVCALAGVLEVYHPPPPQTGVSVEAAPVEAAPVTSEVRVVPDQEEHPTAVE